VQALLDQLPSVCQPQPPTPIPIPTPLTDATLLNAIRSALLSATPYFDSTAHLRTLFTDPRLLAYQHQLSETDSRASRIDRLLDTFHTRHTQSGIPLLSVLLYVLADRFHDETGGEDARIAELRRLADQWHAQPTAPSLTNTPTPASRPHLFFSYSESDASYARQLSLDLDRHGHAVSLLRSAQKGSNAWLEATAAALSQAYAVIVFVGPQTRHDHWVQVELLAALDKRKQIIPLQLGDHALPVCLPPDVTPLDFPFAAYESAVQTLLTQLPPPLPAMPHSDWISLSPHLLARAAELIYMDHLKLAELSHVAQYTQLSGSTHQHRSRGDRLTLQPVVARPEFAHLPWRQAHAETPLVETKPFTDAIPELQRIRRAVLLGDPGAGKTTTLYKLAADLIDSATLDPQAPLNPQAPIPLMVRLGEWREANESFPHFLQRAVGELGNHLEVLLTEGRVALLLDGLNEIPARQHASKYRALKQYLAQHPHVLAIVSCREGDYPPDRELTLDKITVAPLDPVRVAEFVHNYLAPTHGADAAESLFWQLAGAEAHATYERFQEAVGAKLNDPFATFWLNTYLPEGIQWGWGKSDYQNHYWQQWLSQRAQPASLLRLAFNPYMLFMLVDVYQEYGQTLPTNRGQLFAQFVETLLVREGLFARDNQTGQVIRLPEGEALLTALRDLAMAMQTLRVGGRQADAYTSLPLDQATPHLDERQRYFATSANLITVGEEVRFAHQLLQEYFVALGMEARIKEKLRADKLWAKNNWWQPTNWEEATILLAGLYSNDCSDVLYWLADAQPELTARCIQESGADTPDDTKLQLRAKWLPRLTDLKRDRHPQARAAVGRALGMVTLKDGTPLDNRPGVAWVQKGKWQIPDIQWGKTIPAGEYDIGGDKAAYQAKSKQISIDQPFRLATYPVTYAQFHCFAIAPDFGNDLWWRGMPISEKDVLGTTYQLRELSDQSFPFWNHPRERVSWYQAIAFCRWLSHKLGYEVDLPHEYEWEVAARYPDNRHYAWGNEFDDRKANTNKGERIGQTSAVGIYPHGGQPHSDLRDMNGNVWEWCRNKYEDPKDDKVDDIGARRVVRGGSWLDNQDLARSAARFSLMPDSRLNPFGFRVVVRPPSRDH
jgi:formylglycine-generating enzyme required for sulfatase activity